jgi:hypothetical protein
MNNDILSQENTVARRGRQSRVAAKPEADAPVARKTTRVRPTSGALADRLAVPQYIKDAYPDCVFFWENDEKGKVQIRESRGWEIVRGNLADGKWQEGNRDMNLGNVLRIPVGPGETKSDLEAVLMMLPLEWYEDDCRAQEEANRQLENSLRRGSNSQDVNPDGTYAPRLPNGKIGYHREVGSR